MCIVARAVRNAYFFREALEILMNWAAAAQLNGSGPPRRLAQLLNLFARDPDIIKHPGVQFAQVLVCSPARNPGFNAIDQAQYQAWARCRPGPKVTVRFDRMGLRH
jgi:hypothetical protein